MPGNLVDKVPHLDLQLRLVGTHFVNQAPVPHLRRTVESRQIDHLAGTLPADQIGQQTGVDDRGDAVFRLWHAERRRRRRVAEVGARRQLEPAAQAQPVDLCQREARQRAQGFAQLGEIRDECRSGVRVPESGHLVDVGAGRERRGLGRACWVFALDDRHTEVWVVM